MKECKKCEIEKNLDEFYKNSKNSKSGLSAWCKECQKKDKKEHYKNNKSTYIQNGLDGRRWFIEFKKTLKCERCGFSHPAALDFHHIDPSTKLFSFGNINPVYKNKEKILDEIKKCEVLCSNCHRIHHSFNY